MDKFYTRKKIVKKILKYVKKNIDIDYELDLIIEPSAGNGSFIKGIKKMSKHYILLDIIPENEKIKQCDFLEWFINDKKRKKYRKIHVVGNPPFGKQSSLAKKFIKHATLFCDSISFILPRSFKKIV